MRKITAKWLLSAAFFVWLLAALLSLALWRIHGAKVELLASRQRLLRSLAPDLARLERYEAVERYLAGIKPLHAQVVSLPAGWSEAPTRREIRRLPASDGWRGIEATLSWPRLPAADAFGLLSYFATSAPPWRVVTMRLVALEEPAQCALDLTLETAEVSDLNYYTK